MKTSALFFLLFFLPACMAMTKISEFYYTYINPSPSISLDNKDLAHGMEYRFSRAIMPVDSPLSALVETITARDHLPDSAILRQIILQYPWLESVGIFDSDGRILDQAGHDFQLNATNLLTMENLDERKARLLQDKTGLFVLLYPVYTNNIWAGFKAASFRADKLMRQSPLTEQLALFFEDRSVFCGLSFSSPETMLRELKEDDSLHDSFKDNDTTYCWLRRNIGGRWLIYAYAEKN